LALLIVDSDLNLGGPGKKEIRDALRTISKQARSLAETLEELDSETLCPLAEAAAQQLGPFKECADLPVPHGPPHFDDNHKRIDAWIGLLRQWRPWFKYPLIVCQQQEDLQIQP
jgi:uridine kinase